MIQRFHSREALMETLDPEAGREAAIEQVLKLDAKMNIGEPPVTGRVELGSERRKRFSAATKLHDPLRGLDMVCDGVGSELGAAVAATEMAKIAHRELGEKLDREIDNNARRADDVDVRVRHIDALVENALKSVFVPVARALEMQGLLSGEMKDAGVKASITKLVTLPDQRQRLFVGHIGDARVFVERAGTLFQLTTDDTDLQLQRNMEIISEQDLEGIDQAVNPAQLSREHQQMFGLRGGSVSLNARNVGKQIPEVDTYDVQSGDRVLIVNAGVHHNLLLNELQELMAHGRSDQETEMLIQASADHEAGKKAPRGRAEAADLAVVVHTIFSRGPDRAYLNMDRARVERKAKLEKEIAELEARMVNYRAGASQTTNPNLAELRHREADTLERAMKMKEIELMEVNDSSK